MVKFVSPPKPHAQKSQTNFLDKIETRMVLVKEEQGYVATNSCLLGGKSDALEVCAAPVHSFLNSLGGFVYFRRLFAVEFNATDL